MTVKKQVLVDNDNKVVVSLINDNASVDSANLIIDVSTLAGAATDPRLALSELQWSVTGGSVTLLWGASADVEIFSVSGNGKLQKRIKNEAGAGVTGDVRLTTKNFSTANGSNYSIVASFSKVSGWDLPDGSDSLG